MRLAHAETTALEIGFSPDEFSRILPAAEALVNGHFDALLAFEDTVLCRRDNADTATALVHSAGLDYELGTLALSLLLTYCAHSDYRRRGIDDTVFRSSMRDIYVWSRTCLANRNKLGMYRYAWIRNFYTAEIVRLHRLEFHIIEFPFDVPYSDGTVTVQKGDPVINIHIPADGPLKPADVDVSLSLACDYFHRTGAVPFVCNSWILYPKNRLFCAPDSRLMRFLDRFTILEARDKPNSSDLRRIFGERDSYDPPTLPETTTLQRNLKKHLCSGGTMGRGYGILLYNRNKI